MVNGDASFLIDGGRDGVLLIHGLSGTPTEMRFIGRELGKRGYTVHAPQLAGHCQTEDDLLKTGWRDWYGTVATAYSQLRERCDNVFVGGLSLGALLALRLAADFSKNGPAGIALYSTTLWYDGWNINRFGFLLPLILRLPFGDRYDFREEPPYGIKDQRLRKIVASRMLSGDVVGGGLPVIRGRSLRELHRLIRRVKREVPSIKTPALVVHAVEDDVTSLRNASFLERSLGGPVRKVLLDDCYHMITVDRQRHEVVRSTAEFFEALTQVNRVAAHRNDTPLLAASVS
jgi:carboxylesterase